MEFVEVKQENFEEDFKDSLELINDEIDCDVCGKTLPSKISLEKHVLYVHFNAKTTTMNENSLKKREYALHQFEKFLKQTNQEPLTELISNTEELENALCNYFKSQG